MIGQTISHYHITEKLGEGGMGVVYKAEDTKLKRPVALKFLAAHLLNDGEVRARFTREAEAAAALNHPHICHVYEIDEVEGKTFIAMAFIEGQGLDKKIEAGPLKLKTALDIAIQAAKGLQAAHGKGIVHRDTKPANLMVGPDGHVTIMDFGLAQLTDRSKLTRTDETMGTVTYMSPEQTYGMELDHRTDIWSLGVVIYEMVSGQQPFKGHYDKAVMYSITNEEPEPMTALRTGVPMELELLVNKCLAKEANRRYQSTADVVVDLETLSDKLTSGKSTTLAPRAASQTVMTQPPPAEADRPGSESHPLVRYHVIEDLDSRGDSVVYRAEDTQLKRSVTINVMPESAAREAERRMRTKDRALLAGGFLLVVAVAVASILAAVHFGEAPVYERVVRFSVPTPEGGRGPFTVSPDGRHIAFSLITAGRIELWVRPLDSLEARALPGAQDAWLPFWSPDSTQIGFFSEGKLKKIAIAGGPPQTLSDAADPWGGTWNSEGEILFAPGRNGVLHRVSERGGVSAPVTTFDVAEGQGIYSHPRFLPDGRHFLYLHSSAGTKTGTYLASLDSKEVRRLLADDTQVEYAPGSPGQKGHLLFVREGTLVAQPFDAGSLQMAGDLFPVMEQVRVSQTGIGRFSVSEDGVLVVVGGEDSETFQMVWVDRSGSRLGLLGKPAEYSNPALSPDENKLAVGILDPRTRTRDLWVFDLIRGTSSRLTFDPADDLNPLWSPDGTRIVFTSLRKGQRDIYQKPASGAGETELVFESGEPKSVEDWSPDGQFVVYNHTGRFDLLALPMTGERTPIPLFTEGFAEHQGRLSPNGRWIAYSSVESGSSEIYVQSFPPAWEGEEAVGRGKWQISTNGGTQAAWRRDGKELFYLEDGYVEDGKMMAVDVRTDSGVFEAGVPRTLFQAPPLSRRGRRNHYVVSADGQRFLFNALVEEERESSLTVVLNWLEQAQR